MREAENRMKTMTKRQECEVWGNRNYELNILMGWGPWGPGTLSQTALARQAGPRPLLTQLFKLTKCPLPCWHSNPRPSLPPQLKPQSSKLEPASLRAGMHLGL